DFQPFKIISLYWNRQYFARWAGHQAANSGELADLLEFGFRCARFDNSRKWPPGVQGLFKLRTDSFCRPRPDTDELLIALFRRNDPILKLFFNIVSLRVS